MPEKAKANFQDAEILVSESPVPVPGTDGVPGSSDVSLGEPDLMAVYSRFTPTQRIVIIAVASTIGLLSPLSSNLYTPAIPAVARDLNVSTDAINLTITSYLVLQGISPTLWSAIGDSTGRRLLFLIALTIYLASCLGLALSRNYPAVVALRAVQAVGSASTTAIGASLIGDLIHVSRRGKYMGNYSALGGAGTAFGPVIGGVFAQYTGWRGMFVFLASLAAFLLLFTALLLPETKRGIVDDGSIRPPRYLRAPLEWLDAPKSGNGVADAKAGSRFPIDTGAPVRLLVEPECLCIVIFTVICYTVWQVTMVATATLYAERYGLDEMSIGLTYISNGVGSLCCSVLTGKLLDREYKHQLRRERAAQQAAADNADGLPPVKEVQHIELARIKPVIIPTVAYLVSVVALGWIIEFHVHIAASITMSFFVGGLDTIILAAFSTLIVDLFRSQSFSATASMNLSRCLLASGGTAAIGPLIRAVGVGWAFTLCAMVALASCSLALLELWRGRHWRAKRMREAVQREKAASRTEPR
ncbi:major facilitator superfamily transporter [Colletotrichum graminicola M1.001]|uniref:Major facilitator superfamily transporter n=1 Tax=Colletotrichum graminicola (strain M1.001 / M2 / FGSC 10212) TaxID=645133 RepID=E3QW79_COLGM|nr:major facilitator superfamily transporter [Colletotrichum graminicola M1.001]EFQ35113.1 major facilitator superfamily transporter [Colletotrichum graminicola M1.001]